MNRRRWPTVAVGALVLASASYASFRAGVNVAVASAVYVDSIPIQQELKCFESKDVECLRVHWHLRAGIAAQVARSVLQAPLPSSVDNELRAYLKWHEELPPYQPRER
jgi:hypothetical protein